MKKTIKKKATKPKAVVLDESNIHSVLAQMKKPFEYTATLKVFGKQYSSFGSTSKEAIENLQVPGKVGGICVLTLSKGETTQNKILNAMQLFRLFRGSRIMREIALKQLTNIFSI